MIDIITPPAGATIRPDYAAIQKSLRDPFQFHVVRWLPKAKASTNGRRPCVPYLEFATIVDRLDQVVGTHGWQSRIEVLNDGAALCELKVRLGDDWIVKSDVGAVGPKDDAASRVKAATSDALKRAAAKFGVGTYLAFVPRQWLDYDDDRKRVSGFGQLPPWALPGGEGRPPVPSQDYKNATAVGNAIGAAFQHAADPPAFSVARFAYLHAVGCGKVGPTQIRVIRGIRQNAAARLKINDPSGDEE